MTNNIGVIDHLQVGVRSRRYSETDTPRHSFVRVQRFQFAAEQMRGEAEAAGVLIENRHQVIGNNVFVRVFKEKIVDCANYKKSNVHPIILLQRIFSVRLFAKRNRRECSAYPENPRRHK